MPLAESSAAMHTSIAERPSGRPRCSLEYQRPQTRCSVAADAHDLTKNVAGQAVSRTGWCGGL